MDPHGSLWIPMDLSMELGGGSKSVNMSKQLASTQAFIRILPFAIFQILGPKRVPEILLLGASKVFIKVGVGNVLGLLETPA